MPDRPPPGSPPQGAEPQGERLDSWKEIAALLRRDVTTVQRWEKREGMPVHRHLHDKVGSVYAFRAELETWARSRSIAVGGAERLEPAAAAGDAAPENTRSGVAEPKSRSRRVLRWLGVLAAGFVLVLGIRGARRPSAREGPLVDARFSRLTDFDGIEQAAALSRDGRFAAFQSDRDGKMDVWVTQVGTGQFVNLTRGALPDLVNLSVRTLGFSPDGTLVTFWARAAAGAGRPDIGVWAVPLLGGLPRPYLEGAAEYDWSPDGTRLAFHTAGSGDPLFLRESIPPATQREIFSAPPGRHGHFPLWSPDQAFLYFVLGAPPDRMDIWRLKPTGGVPDRITFHDAAVSYPVFLDAKTLLYLATEPDGSGPWIFGLHPGERTPRRVSTGVEAYSSLAASADGRRLVATLTSPKRTLWRVPVAGERIDFSSMRRVTLTTGEGASPRLGPGFLLYVSSAGAREGVWKLEGGAASEIWSTSSGRVLGAPAIRRDGRRVAITVREGERTFLHLLNVDGTDLTTAGSGLELRGAPAWAADGQSLVVTAMTDGAPRLTRVPLDGGAPAPLVREDSQDPACSPTGDTIAWSGPDVGTTFPVHAIRADGSALSTPALTLSRGGRHVVFMPDGRSLVVLRGESEKKDLWIVDLETGASRQMTTLPGDFTVRDFDLSPDGKELVLERAQQQSDIVLIERPAR